MKYVVVNTYPGDPYAVGPFDTEELADKWVQTQPVPRVGQWLVQKLEPVSPGWLWDDSTRPARMDFAD